MQKKSSLFKCTFALGTLLLASGCVSMSSLQTAETLQPGQTQTTYGGGFYQSSQFVKNTDTSDLKLPYMEFSYREGLSDRWDFGGKITVIGSAVVDAKYQFFRGERFHAAVGAGLGYFEMSTGSEAERTTVRAIDGIVPLYASYNFAETLAAYVSPRYVLRSVSGASSATDSLGGGAFGFKIGKSWGAYLEAAYQKQLGGDFSATQYNVSIFVNRPGGLLASLGF